MSDILNVKQKVLDAIARGKAKRTEEVRLQQRLIDEKLRKERQMLEAARERAALFVMGTLPDLVEKAAAKGESRVLVDTDQHGTPHIAEACEAAGLTVVKEYMPPQLSWDGRNTVDDYSRYYVTW